MIGLFGASFKGVKASITDNIHKISKQYNNCPLDPEQRTLEAMIELDIRAGAIETEGTSHPVLPCVACVMEPFCWLDRDARESVDFTRSRRMHTKLNH